MLRRCFVLASALAASAAAQAAPQTLTLGQPAPAFSVQDTQGKTVSLADFKGKTVVLEWINPDCPFVKKHYGAGNMQSTQRAATAQGVVWLTVASTAPQHADYKKPADLSAWMQSQKAAATHTLMDENGKLGRAWGARTTPHLYVVNAAGTLAYAGAIDSKASANPADISSATNFVNQALAELNAGKPVSQPNTQPYGCSVKYSN
jgi:peroxiredoxin